IEQVAEHVHARGAQVGAQLDARNHGEPGAARRLERLQPAGRRVVVGEGDRGQAGLDRGTDELTRGLRAVRHRTGRVQIDESVRHPASLLARLVPAMTRILAAIVIVAAAAVAVVLVWPQLFGLALTPG